MDRDWLQPAVRPNRFAPMSRWTGAGRYDHALCATTRVVVMKNCLDAALIVYPVRRPLAKEALGRVGLRWTDRLALGSQARRVVELPVCDRLGVHHIWAYYVAEPTISCQIAPMIFGR